MKKITLLITVALLLFLSACTDESVTVPDFVGMPYGDVLAWAQENDIEIEVSSEYSDLVDPQSVISQGTEAGAELSLTGTLVIVYSRGYDPNGEIVVPDLEGLTVDEISTWLADNDITKYYFYDTFNPDVPEGEFVRAEVTNTEDRDNTLRKDTYFFYFSKGDLEYEPVVFANRNAVRGVNLGGWFVLEGWMTPDLFDGVDGSDETAFMEQKPDALNEIENHWDTFITEEDFQFLQLHGIEYIRLPIPWWMWGETFEYTHDAETHNVTYGNSVYYIERAMEWAETYDIKVLLDLHTAPGCQNGFDNGGIAGVLQWPRAENVAKTLEVIDDIAEHFSDYESLWGIEVLNEPGWGVDMTILQNYYLDSYELIRAHNEDIWVGFHDGFRGYMTATWENFFTGNDLEKVFFDIHLYQVFGDGWGSLDIYDHVEYVHDEQYEAVHRFDSFVPTIVGEWSLGLQGNVFEGLDTDGVNQVRMAFGNAQLNVYEGGMGWFFWNYKIDANSHVEWDMKRLIEYGLFPQYFRSY